MSLQWETEVLPVLEAVHRATARHEFPAYGIDSELVAAELGRANDDRDMAFALRRLIEAGYLKETLSSDVQFAPKAVELTERGLQVTAGWPTGPGDALLSSLLAEVERRIATTASAEERSALERFRDFALGVGRDVLVGVLSAYADRAVRGVGGNSAPD
jgi:hypothetical protein